MRLITATFLNWRIRGTGGQLRLNPTYVFCHLCINPLFVKKRAIPHKCYMTAMGKVLPVLINVAHTRLPSVGFRSWSRFLAVSLQVTKVINPAVGCHYFPPGPQLPLQAATLKRSATNFAAWWTEARWVWAVCLRLLPDNVVTAIWTRALQHLSPAR